MHILVTGAAGFLGSHLVDALIADGQTVIGVDNLITGSEANLAHLQHEKNFDFLRQDIIDPFDVGKVDYVFNLASPASPVDYMIHGIETLLVGSYGTRNALEIAKRYGAGFLHTSTSECYGDPLIHPPARELLGQRKSDRSSICLR